MFSRFRFVFALVVLAIAGDVAYAAPAEQADGYRGIWYMNQSTGDEYKYKYSGGFATYPQQQEPIAIYSAAVNKTFFVYGGSDQVGQKSWRRWSRISTMRPAKSLGRASS